jgi:hypothetical protein
MTEKIVPWNTDIVIEAGDLHESSIHSVSTDSFSSIVSMDTKIQGSTK